MFCTTLLRYQPLYNFSTTVFSNLGLALGSVSNTTELSWHRRLRKQRQTDRALAQAFAGRPSPSTLKANASACCNFAVHHGSSVPTMGWPSQRQINWQDIFSNGSKHPWARTKAKARVRAKVNSGLANNVGKSTSTTACAAAELVTPKGRQHQTCQNRPRTSPSRNA